LLLASLLRQPTAAQVLDPTFTPPSGLYAPGTVYALGPQQADGKRLVAGNFLRINTTACQNLVRLGATGAVDTAFTRHVGNATNISRILALANGQYLLGAAGGDVKAGGLTRTDLLRLNADGSADALFSSGTGPTSTRRKGYAQNYAVQPDGKILVVGLFDTYDGQAAAGVVRLQPNGSLDTSFSVGTGVDVNSTIRFNQVSVVAVQPDGKILVGGSFSTFNGNPANGLVRLNANGSRDTSFTSTLPTNAQPSALLLQPDGKMVITGYGFLFLTRLNANGSLDNSFSTGGAFSPPTSSYDSNLLLQPDGKILVFGPFYRPGASGVARLNTDGSLDTSFQASPGASNSPNTFGLQADGSLLVGGNFNSLNGVESSLGRLTSAGAPDLTFSARILVPGDVSAVVRQSDGQFMLAGNFTEFNGQAVHRVIRVSATGSLDASFAAAVPVQPAPVTCLVVQTDGKVLAGSSMGLRRMLASGAPDATLPASIADLQVAALATQPDGKTLVSGDFNFKVGSITHQHLLRLTAAGGLDPTFVRADAPAGTILGATSALLVQANGQVLLSEMYRLSGLNDYTSRLLRFSSTGDLDTSFDSTVPFTAENGTTTALYRVNVLAQQPDGKILAGGTFGAVAGQVCHSVARLTTSGTPDASFVPPAALSGAVSTLAVQPNGRVVLGGSFTAGSYHYLARLLPTGRLDSTFATTANPIASVATVLVQPNGAIMLGGSFTSLGGVSALYIARITAPNVLAVPAPAAVAARTQAWPVPAHSVLHVAPDAGAQLHTLELLDGLGRAVRTLLLTSATPEVALSVEGLPTGLYLLRVGYATGTVTRTITVE